MFLRNTPIPSPSVGVTPPTTALVNIFGAMFIAQRIVGKKSLDEFNALSAASMKQNGSDADKIDILDAMFIAQYITALRNAYFD